jgi:hypothetical protein
MRDKKQIAKRMILAVAMTLPSLAGQIGAGVATATILSPLAANANPREMANATKAEKIIACADHQKAPTALK